MHLPPYLSAEAIPEKLGRGKAGKIIVTLDTEKLPKLGITRASVYLSRFPGDKVGSENEIPVSVSLLPDFSNLTEQQKNNPPVVSSVGASVRVCCAETNPKEVAKHCHHQHRAVGFADTRHAGVQYRACRQAEKAYTETGRIHQAESNRTGGKSSPRKGYSAYLDDN